MIKKLILFSLFFVSFILAKAQQPVDFLNELATNTAIEKIHLHFDRENYTAGDIIQFKAYLNSDFLPDTTNTTMYVELIDGTKSITKYVYPVFFSSARGSISLPDTLSTGYYTLRAFSNGMLMQNDDYFFQQKLYVYGVDKKQVDTKIDEIKLSFFPEGGSLVEGLTSTVAFKATDKNGMPIDVTGNIYNSKNEPIIYFLCLHDGMGIFDIKPLPEEKYYIKLNSNSGEKKYYLPEIQNKGVAVALVSEEGGSSFEIRQKTGDNNFEAAYMIGQMQHHVVFKKEFTKQQLTLKGFVETKNLPSGIMQITVFNKNDMPLAERLIFVNNNEYLITADIKTDTLDFSEGGKNKFFVNLKDTVKGQISISVTDAYFDLNLQRENNILSSFLLTTDLNGYVNNPSWYLSSNEDSVKNALDILMMVNGWRRFKWSEIKNLQTKPKVSKNNFISLSGNVVLEGTKKPLANKTMMLLATSSVKKNKRSTLLFDTDKDGSFKIDSLVLFDRNKLLFIEVRGKKSQSVDVYVKTDTFFATVALPKKSWLSFKNKYEVLNAQTKIDYENGKKAKGLLQEVIVKSKQKTKLATLEDKYISGLFNTNARTTIDLVNSEEANNYANIFDYLRTNLNGVQVLNDGLNYSLYYRANTTGSNIGSGAMTIYLDEVETDASAIENIPANQIALVKVYSTFLGGAGNSQDGAIAIYTKKAEDYKNPSPASNIKIYNGYSVSKEFYAPDYKVTKAGLDIDTRITIDWRPQIFFNNINPKIPFSFYNNNRTKSFKVVVEGVTTTGKLIFIEKIITP